MRFPLIVTVLLLISFHINAQKPVYSKQGFVIPKDLKQCVSELDRVFSKKAKSKFRLLDESQLRKVGQVYLLGEWAENDSTPYVQYFNSLGLSNAYRSDRDYIVLLAYSRFLKGMPVDVSQEIRTIADRNDSVQKARIKRYELIIESDTLNGFYIPSSIDECMKELDLHTDADQKQDLKKCRVSDVVPSYYITLGVWMLNRWNLTEGSRIHHLLKAEGIEYPDGMASVLLRAYHEYLTSPKPDYSKVINDYKPEYRKMIELLSANERQLKGDHRQSQQYIDFLRHRKIDDFVVYKY